MENVVSVNREGVEGVPQLVMNQMGKARRHDYLREMDPLNGKRPDGSRVRYVADGNNPAGQSAAAGSGLALVLPSHGRRIGARAVDMVLASVLSVSALALVIASTDGGLLVVLLPVACAGGAVLYFVAQVHLWGTTIGKRVFGLRVARLWSDGTLPPTWKDAFIREFDRAAFLSIPVLNLLIGAILLFQMFKDRPYHQSKYDRAARTVVVRWPSRN
jgi:uncharacterized RDD family membrane protein YckC